MKNSLTTNIDQMRQSLQDKMPEFRMRYGVKSLGIFGSHVHGLQKKWRISC